MKVFLRQLPPLATSVATMVLLFWATAPVVYALTPAQLKTFQYQIYNYDNAVNTACAAALAGSGTSINTSADQEAIAKIIIGVAKTDNLGKEGALIGLMAGITESKLTIYANSNVPLSLTLPHQQVGHDHDSLGIMQQRISTDWSTISSSPDNKDAVAQLMDPTYNAEAFFGSPPGSSAPSALSKGLQNISGWQSMDPWKAAQSVQHSAFPDGSNYRSYMTQAQSLLNKLWDSSPAVPLPVAFTASTASSSTGSVSNSSCVNPCNTTTTDTSISTVRQQVVCTAEAEYQAWQAGSIKPGTGFHKYSQGRDENWCADFVSWVYNQANYPLDTGAKDGNVPAVGTIETIGKADALFHYHSAASYTPKPGDLAIHYRNGQPSHVNIVTAVAGSTVTLIGGNQTTYDFKTSTVSQYNINTPTDDGITGYVSPD